MKKRPTSSERLSANKTWQLYLVSIAGGLITGQLIGLITSAIIAG